VLSPLSTDPSLAAVITDSGGAIRAEALYAVTHEGAMHLEDVLERRLRVWMESSDFGLAAAPEIAAIMAECLGWNDDRVRDELENYTARVRRHIAAMVLPDDRSADAAMAAVTPVVRAVRSS
jgi:glycerol-3-phosphate dehydrogenase